MLVTAKPDEISSMFPVTARVGQAVETVGQAGKVSERSAVGLRKTSRD